MTPLIVSDISELRQAVAQAKARGQRVGLVPTMGALHDGHLSLVERSRRECDFTIVTIFVNPTQFAPSEDFGRYPRMLEADCQRLMGLGVDLVFAPTVASMYPAGHATFVDPGGAATRWEAEFRPGHFRGVATIVLKLFNLVQPDRAYFGRKDFQQAVVIRHMIRDLDLPLHVEVCPTIREPDGLAMSSRNAYLSSDERQRAVSISEGLQQVKKLVGNGTTDTAVLIARIKAVLVEAKMQIDYIAVVDRETLEPLAQLDKPGVMLVAARVGNTRLIDNELLP